MNYISQLDTSGNDRANSLTDGQLIVSYQEIPRLLTKIDRLFGEWGVGKEECVVLECENSVPSALVLLYLLENAYSTLLVPKVDESALSNQKQNLPQFSHYKVVAESQTQKGHLVDLNHPDQFITCSGNKRGPRLSSPGAQKLYLKTSGSTGTPKLVMHAHSQLRENVLNCVKRLKLQSDDRVAIPVPIYHMYGLGAAFLPSVLVGASIDLQKGANLLRYLQREQQFQPNVAFMTPIFCKTLVKGRRSQREYKLTVAAGDVITPETFTSYEDQMGCLVKLYGSTEMGAIAAGSPEDSHELRLQTIGRPMPGVQLRLERQQGETNPDHQGVGELWCCHDCGFEGYVDENGQPVAVPQDQQGGWFRTKDLAKINDSGYVEVLGRCDHSVNRDGRLVFFADVEKAVKTLSEVEEVVVVAQGQSQRGKGIVAHCVLTKGSNRTGAELRSACFEILPKRAIPDHILIIDSLPLLPNGKVDRQKLVIMGGEKVNSVNLAR